MDWNSGAPWFSLETTSTRIESRTGTIVANDSPGGTVENLSVDQRCPVDILVTHRC